MIEVFNICIEKQIMKYLIIDSRYGFFVTKNAPRIIRRHLKEIGMPSGLNAWSNLISIKSEESAFCNQVFNILDSDFESGTNSFRMLKQSLENNMTYAQALIVVAKIEYMMFETIPCVLLNCSELINEVSGMHIHNEKTPSSVRIGTDAVACCANLGCMLGGYKIIEHCDAIMAELDREQNEYHWERTPYEERWYRWAKSTRDKMLNCIPKALGGVLCNGVKVAVDSVDAINAADGKTL